MFLSGEKLEGEKCISAQGSSVKGSSQQSSTFGPKVKGGGPLFSGQGPLIMGGLVNDTTPASVYTGYSRLRCVFYYGQPKGDHRVRWACPFIEIGQLPSPSSGTHAHISIGGHHLHDPSQWAVND